jgi:tRNA G18 (ribose-2'-O)-methylase SpoU
VIHHVDAADPRLEPYRRVGDRVWLRERDLFVAEGRLVVGRLLALGRFDVESVVLTPSALAAMQHVVTLIEADVYVCDPTALRTVTGFNFHRGCLALARRPPALAVEHLLGAPRLVALEAVGNPDNIGGVFRTAAALGAGGVLLDPTSGDPFYRKAIRTSMAATLTVPWVRLDRWPRALHTFQSAGFSLVALTPHAPSISVSELSSGLRGSDRIVLLLGAEGSGLTEGALQLADARVRIPIDAAVDSLNVAVAAGIALDRLR